MPKLRKRQYLALHRLSKAPSHARRIQHYSRRQKAGTPLSLLIDESPSANLGIVHTQAPATSSTLNQLPSTSLPAAPSLPIVPGPIAQPASISSAVRTRSVSAPTSAVAILQRKALPPTGVLTRSGNAITSGIATVSYPETSSTVAALQPRVSSPGAASTSIASLRVAAPEVSTAHILPPPRSQPVIPPSQRLNPAVDPSAIDLFNSAPEGLLNYNPSSEDSANLLNYIMLALDPNWEDPTKAGISTSQPVDAAAQPSSATSVFSSLLRFEKKNRGHPVQFLPYLQLR